MGSRVKINTAKHIFPFTHLRPSSVSLLWGLSIGSFFPLPHRYLVRAKLSLGPLKQDFWIKPVDILYRSHWACDSGIFVTPSLWKHLGSLHFPQIFLWEVPPESGFEQWQWLFGSLIACMVWSSTNGAASCQAGQAREEEGGTWREKVF